MSKMDQVVAALKASELDCKNWADDKLREVGATVLKAIRDPAGIYPHQVGAWQGIIDKILSEPAVEQPDAPKDVK